MRTEIQYRSFEELLDSVKIDMPTQDMEGIIDPAQLLKVVARVSYKLGLRINPSRSKMIEIVDGKARMPADFDVLNFALLCGDKRMFGGPMEYPVYKTYCQGVADGVEMTQDTINSVSMETLYTEVTDISLGNNTIQHDLDSVDFIVQIFDTDGSLLDFKVQPAGPNSIVIISEIPSTLLDLKVVILRGSDDIQLDLIFQDLNICDTGVVTTPCSNTVGVGVVDDCGENVVTCTTEDQSYTYHYHDLIILDIAKSKSSSADEFNFISRSKLTVMLKNNFLVANFKEGEVYINYQSLMEDDDGNLLVMSHPLVDEYYEYALKQRIYENKFLAGDNTVGNQLQLVENKLRTARVQAMGFVVTPDFRELKKMWETNRKAQYSKYYDMFKSHPVTKSTF